MSSIFKAIVFVILLLPSFDVLAAKNPVAWQLNQSFPGVTYPGRTYTVTYTFTSQLPVTMIKPLVIQKNASPASDFSYTDECTGSRLSPNQSCTVQITLVPAAAGNESMQLVIAGYSNDSVPVPTLTTQVQGSSVSNVYGTVTQNLPGSLGVGIAGNYVFSFSNKSSSDLTSVSLVVAQTSGSPVYTSANCGSTIKAGTICTVNGSYTPSSISPNLQTVSATLNYGSGKSVAVSTSTSIPQATGVVASFIGSESLPGITAPTTPAAYPPAPLGSSVGVLFTNAGPDTVYITSPSITSSLQSTTAPFTKFPGANGDSCTAVPYLTLNVGAACQLAGSLNTSSTPSGTAVTVTAQVNYATTPGGTPTTVSLASITNVISSLPTSRTITFVNNCGFDIWYSMNGAIAPGSCSGGCPTGTSCSSDGNCYWTNYPPLASAVATNKLASGGSPVSQTIPATSTDPTVQWSGNFSASLGCTGNQTSGSCVQATCSNQGGASCAPGKGFSQPATQAEFTMLLNGADSYDVETINGFHIPISITPVYSVSPSVAAVSNNYTCNVAAANPAASGFGVCDWSIASPPSSYYNWVTSNNNAGCNSCPSLSTTQVCGLDSSFNYGCGKFLGYWSADQVCGSSNVPATVQTIFGCNTPLASLDPTGFFPSGYTLYDLMACPVPKNDPNSTLNSCYKTYPSQDVPANNQLQCCGCIDWWTVSGIGANSNTTSCTKPGQVTAQTDPIWNSYIQSTVAWMKKACPSAYVYPFDDVTSTFTCTNTLNGLPNSTSYVITFCPNNNTGLPTGKSGSAEGRG